jgi:predicted nuclease of predicted toxin-antitoxin system
VKLLIDENLSPALALAWQEPFPGTQHVFDIGLGNSDDPNIWEYAKTNGFAIITKDSDFEQRSYMLGAPPKVIWLRVGNRPTSYVNLLVLQYVERINEFLLDRESALFMIP